MYLGALECRSLDKHFPVRDSAWDILISKVAWWCGNRK